MTDKRKAILEELFSEVMLFGEPRGHEKKEIINQALSELSKLELTKEEIEEIIHKSSNKICRECKTYTEEMDVDLADALLKAIGEKRKEEGG